jgi:hypothetical protein
MPLTFSLNNGIIEYQLKKRIPMINPALVLPFYVSPNGDYGDATGLVVIDVQDFDDHFFGYLDQSSDWLRPSYAEWFEDNQHDFEQGSLEWACSICDEWFESEN